VEAEHGAISLSLDRQLKETTARLQDLTERSQAWHTLEDQLLQAHRLEEVGRLAACMMPDIESLVSSIGEHGRQLANGLSEDDPRRDPARALRDCTARTASLVRQLLAFSVRQVQPAASIDLNDAVAQAEPVLAQMVGGHIAFEVRLGASGVITASQDDLNQVLTALVAAVHDGLPVGGSLTLDTARVETDSPTAADRNVTSGAMAQVTVRASGYGVEPAQPSRALALAVSRCGGQMRVESDTRSTALIVSLPLRASGVTRESSEGERPERGGLAVVEVPAQRFG
jgi:C4-dicarboxylate-specific signal transduction histidine kinase